MTIARLATQQYDQRYAAVPRSVHSLECGAVLLKLAGQEDLVLPQPNKLLKAAGRALQQQKHSAGDSPTSPTSQAKP